MKRIYSIILSFVLLLSLTFGGRCSAKEKDDISIEENTAAVLASLFVLSNVQGGMWDMNSQIKRIVPMYSKSRNTAAFCVVFSCYEEPAGYVIVSTDLYNQLIVEYSPKTEYITDSITKEALELSNLGQPIYYTGPLQYSCNDLLVEKEREVVVTEEMLKTHDQNEMLLQSISPIVLTLTNDFITNPLSYLQANFPGLTFTLSGSASTNFVYPYTIVETNACVVYATAAILKYYLGSSYNFSTIVNSCCLPIAQGGYAPNTSSGNWYIPNYDTKDYVQACVNYYGLSKTASIPAFSTWAKGTAEINANRPFILCISTSSNYSDHAVTAFAWRRYVDGYANQYRFYEVRDGYVNYARFVFFDSAVTYLVKIV